MRGGACQYDSFGNLRQVILPDARAITYQIDGQHRRIGKSIDGQPVQGLIYMNALEPVAETDGDGNLVSLFVYAERPNTPSYLLNSGNVYRIISDQLGSVRLVVNVTDGSIAQRIDYDAWGNTLEDTHPGFQPFGFAGGIVDQDTGLVRFGARDYDPETGRWTAKDTARFRAGEANLYSYASSNPINYIDSSGEIINLATAAVGAFIGGAVGLLISFDIDHPSKILAGIAGGAASGFVGGLTLGGSLIATAALGSAAGLVGAEVENAFRNNLDNTNCDLSSADRLAAAAGGLLHPITHISQAPHALVRSAILRRNR